MLFLRKINLFFAQFLLFCQSRDFLCEKPRFFNLNVDNLPRFFQICFYENIAGCISIFLRDRLNAGACGRFQRRVFQFAQRSVGKIQFVAAARARGKGACEISRVRHLRRAGGVFTPDKNPCGRRIRLYRRWPRRRQIRGRAQRDFVQKKPFPVS